MKKKRFALYVLNDESERLNGYYCGFWTQFWGMEQYPDVDDTITDQSGNLIKKLKMFLIGSLSKMSIPKPFWIPNERNM